MKITLDDGQVIIMNTEAYWKAFQDLVRKSLATPGQWFRMKLPMRSPTGRKGTWIERMVA